ncbi:UNVERIFIED_CONTAM: putative RING-type E3 ubiquitin transferase C3H69 [Sesamum calycinum]|uniref:RING-type E3 ubiquitin transferase C3H69 n=1 Tax=Sesamum calycinum TaxID=2727403 RepID=A0AAW2NRS8_9LAMI
MRHDIIHNDDDFADVGNFDPADRPICSFAAAGECPRGVNCPQIHGDLCPTCRKHCLHPFRPEEREEHLKTCDKRQKHLEALKHSQEIECSVCLERVLSKPTAAERKFGILSECNHPFCVSCIRNWRSSSPASSSDANSALRTCLFVESFHTLSFLASFGIPRKKKSRRLLIATRQSCGLLIVSTSTLGMGPAPLGPVVFTRVSLESLHEGTSLRPNAENTVEHAYRDGRLEEVVIRHLGSEDGNTVIAKDIRLSDFLNNLQIRAFASTHPVRKLMDEQGVK